MDFMYKGLAMGQGQRCRPVVVTLGSQPPVNCTAAISPRQSQQDVCLVRTPWPVGPNIMQLSSAPELQGRRARAGRGGCGWLWMAVDVDQDWRQNLPISNSFFLNIASFRGSDDVPCASTDCRGSQHQPSGKVGCGAQHPAGARSLVAGQCLAVYPLVI